MRRFHHRILTSISFRLFILNALLVFLPVGAFFFLDTYESQLLRSLEHALVQQGRIFSALLSETPEVDTDLARRTLINLERRSAARIRVIDGTGNLLADSSSLSGREAGPAAGPAVPSSEAPGTSRDRTYEEADSSLPPRQRLIYRIASFPVRLYRGTFAPPQPPSRADSFYSGGNYFDGTEVRRALAGEYGAATRISGGDQVSVTLYSAIPVMNGERVTGAVLVSQSSYRILQDLYELRIQIFLIFLVSLGASLLITLFFGLTISRPIKRIKNEAEAIVDSRGRLKRHFAAGRKRDEIGDLSRALEEITTRLKHHIGFIEGFASDVSHELKNPLASIRSAVELAFDTDDEEVRKKMAELINRDLSRMETRITRIKELSLLDARLLSEEKRVVDLTEIVAGVVESARLSCPPGPRGVSYRIEAGCERAPVAASPERLVQILENLLDNAAGFSPPGGVITVALEDSGESIILRVEDEGPGVVKGKEEVIFDRFVTIRRDPSSGTAGAHAGLGLSIVKTITEGYGGTVRVRPGRTKGAAFILEFPRTSKGAYGQNSVGAEGSRA